MGTECPTCSLKRCRHAVLRLRHSNFCMHQGSEWPRYHPLTADEPRPSEASGINMPSPSGGGNDISVRSPPWAETCLTQREARALAIPCKRRHHRSAQHSRESSLERGLPSRRNVGVRTIAKNAQTRPRPSPALARPQPSPFAPLLQLKKRLRLSLKQAPTPDNVCSGTGPSAPRSWGPTVLGPRPSLAHPALIVAAASSAGMPRVRHDALQTPPRHSPPLPSAALPLSPPGGNPGQPIRAEGRGGGEKGRPLRAREAPPPRFSLPIAFARNALPSSASPKVASSRARGMV